MQQGNHFRYLFGNIIFQGTIICKTGLHIGGSSDTLEIGGIDSFVIRNPLSHTPYIPGSSLKGKLRSIVEKIAPGDDGGPLTANRHAGDREKKVWRHECEDFTKAVNCPLCRIFGSTGKKSENNNYPGILLVRDGELANPEQLKDEGLVIFETKTENCLDRLTSAAHPRTIERVPAGAEFKFNMVFRVEMLGKKNGNKPGDLKSPDLPNLREDLSNILRAMGILEQDGVGGNISRGYGQVELKIDSFNGMNTKGKSLAEEKQTSPYKALEALPAFYEKFVSGL